MIEIDGSYGEGGGQVLRSALALSILTGQPFHIRNIRANRPQPGLKPQHYTVVKMLAELSHANIKGLQEKSTVLSFSPKEISGGSFRFHVGTAGSMVLIFQSMILGCMNTCEPLKIQLTGGTDVKWAPSWDFFTKVFLQVLRRVGVDVDVSLERRGYYPRGGGSATLQVRPIGDLSCLIWDKPFDPSKVYGAIQSSDLPKPIIKRLKHAALKPFLSSGIECGIRTYASSSLSAGIVLTLWTEETEGCVGAVGLGERGVPAERIGVQTSNLFLSCIKSGCTVDEYLFDQILPFLALAGNDSVVRVNSLSSHAKTNMWLVEQFLPGNTIFEIDQKMECCIVRIHGQNIYS